MRTVIVAAILAMTLAACDVTLESNWFHPNGQVLVVGEGQDSEGNRHGAWMHFNADGSLRFEDVIDGVVYQRTGYYEHGTMVRELTRAEMQEMLQEAERLTREYRRSRE